MWKIVLAVFLVAHGLIHLGYLTPAPADPKYPFSLRRSWLIDVFGLDASLARRLGMALGIVAAGGFTLSGLAAVDVVISQIWWLPLAVMASAASLLMLVLFWHSWLVLGLVIDVVLLVTVIGLGWQPLGIS